MLVKRKANAAKAPRANTLNVGSRLNEQLRLNQDGKPAPVFRSQFIANRP
jgi:hypothetical protein